MNTKVHIPAAFIQDHMDQRSGDNVWIELAGDDYLIRTVETTGDGAILAGGHRADGEPFTAMFAPTDKVWVNTSDRDVRRTA